LLAAYVSGHGFGHATRTAEVLREALRLLPELPLTVVTSAPRELFEDALRVPFSYRRLECDVGLAQKDALVIDEEETARRFRAFVSGWDEKVEAEAAFLRDAGARVVLGDIPPLAFAAAASAEVPAVALGNFSWDWIYAHAARRAPELREAAAHCAAAYGKAALLLRLPFAGDLSAFPRAIDIPLVARRPLVPKEDARRRLGLDARPAVLVSFGGIGLPGFRADVLASLADFQLLVPDRAPRLPGNVQAVDGERRRAVGLGYSDVVAAADVVVTKPGYGIVTDAIGARTRLVYTDRGDFPEYPILVEGLKRHLPAAYVTNEEVRSGRLEAALRRVLEAPFPPAPDLSGATRAGELLELLTRGHGL
jgi:L-arabinokinase